MRRRFAVFLLLPLQLALSGAAPSPSSIGELERGKKVYLGICADCHGKNGRGDGPKSRRLGFHPRDFSRAAFKCRCTASGELPTDEDLIRTVTAGLAGTPMAGRSGELSADEIRAVVSYLKTFSPRFASDPAPHCLPIPEPPSSAPEQLTEGKQVYRLLGCWQCHGNSGRGDGPSSPKLEDDWGERIRPHDLTRATGFKCGQTDRDLYRTLHTGLTGSPMPSYSTAFLFGSEAGVNPGVISTRFGAEESKALEAYLRDQPSPAALEVLPEASRQELVARRTWALVRYLQSLQH